MVKTVFLRIVFIALAISLSIPSMAQSSKENGENFIDALFSEQYDKALTYIDSSIKQQVNKETLEKSLTALNKQVGKFKQVSDIRSGEEEPFELIFYLCEFEKAKLDMQIAFNASNKIVGFYFLPPAQADAKKKDQ